MKTLLTSPHRPAERGFTVVIVMTLLAIMASLAVTNQASLRRLQREIALVERQQQVKFKRPAPAAGAIHTTGEAGKLATNRIRGPELKAP